MTEPIVPGTFGVIHEHCSFIPVCKDGLIPVWSDYVNIEPGMLFLVVAVQKNADGNYNMFRITCYIGGMLYNAYLTLREIGDVFYGHGT